MGRGTMGILVAFVAMASTGCACSDKPRRMASRQPEHLIFNPEWTKIPSVDVPRENWPSTSMAGDDSVLVEHEVIIVDRQGGLGHQPDRLSRRFHSVRRGRTVR